MKIEDIISALNSSINQEDSNIKSHYIIKKSIKEKSLAKVYKDIKYELFYRNDITGDITSTLVLNSIEKLTSDNKQEILNKLDIRFMKLLFNYLMRK